MIEGEPVSKYLLDPPKNAGVSVIFSADAIDKLPSHCNTIVQWEKDYSGCYNTLSKFEEREGVAFDRVSLAEMDVFSRQLSNFKVRENASNAAIPDMLTFLDMYKTSRWKIWICTISGWKTAHMKVCVPSSVRRQGNSRFIWISMKNTMVPTVWWLVLQEAESQKHCRPIF